MTRIPDAMTSTTELLEKRIRLEKEEVKLVLLSRGMHSDAVDDAIDAEQTSLEMQIAHVDAELKKRGINTAAIATAGARALLRGAKL